MKSRDYLWCLANSLLDREEELARLCPVCRSRALEAHCSVCGRGQEDWEENPSFDLDRFERMRGEEGFD